MHITETRFRDNKICYRLDRCLCAPGIGQPQTITYQSSLRTPQPSFLIGSPDPHHHDCTKLDTRQTPNCHAIPLPLLQVCRQIYHEASLKPFSQTTFIIDGGYYVASRTFLDALVPTQARAITRVRFACHNGICPAFEVMRRLKKLEILTVQVIEHL